MMILIVIVFLIVVLAILIPPFYFVKSDALAKVSHSLDNRLQQLKQNYQFELKELRRRKSVGDIDEAEYLQLQSEIKSEITSSLESTQKEKSSMNDRPSVLMALVLVILMAGLALPIYHLTGQPSYVPESRNIRQFVLSDSHYIEGLQEKAYKSNEDPKVLYHLLLAIRLQIELKPNDVKSWLEYGRVYSRLGETQPAIDALSKARKLDPDNVEVQLELAQTMAYAEDPQLKHHAIGLIQKVIKEHPDHQGARFFLGITAYQQGDFNLAIDAWEDFLNVVKPSEKVAPLVKERIAQAKRMLAGAPINPHQGTAFAQNTPSEVNSSGDNQPPSSIVEGAQQPLMVHLSVDENIKQGLTGDEVLFVFAKAEAGPRMPLAVFSVKYRDFDGKISLSDTDAMRPELKLSHFEKIRVTARLSKTGSAIASEGDYEGSSDVLSKPYPDVVNVLINSQH